MQYILNEAEYQEILELRSRTQSRLGRLSEKKLGELCVQIATTMPVKWSWGPGKDKPMPWGCITVNEDWHCDECPVRDICPLDHDYSK